MDRTSLQLPLNGWRVVNAPPRAFPLAAARISVDDHDWGTILIEDAQRRLEAADDFAIVMLAAEFRAAADTPGLVVEANSEGLRNMLLDRAYMVPVKGEVAAGFLRYQLPDPLKAGEHVLSWSYAWNPPKDKATGALNPEGVALSAPRLLGDVEDRGGSVAPAGVSTLDLRAGELPGRSRIEREVEVPAWARSLHVEGAVRGTLAIEVDGLPLVPRGDAPQLCDLPPGTPARATLALAAAEQAVRIRSLRLLG